MLSDIQRVPKYICLNPLAITIKFYEIILKHITDSAIPCNNIIFPQSISKCSKARISL